MTVEYLSAKLIEKAMSEQNAYVPPNRNLIVAAETLKKQQAEIERLQKEVNDLKYLVESQRKNYNDLSMQASGYVREINELVTELSELRALKK